MKINWRTVSTLLLIFCGFSAIADHWTRMADFPGSNVDNDFSFCIAGKCYVGCGFDTLGQVTNFFYEYDPATDTWTRKADFAGAARWGATGFSIGNKGYAGLGNSGNELLDDFWQYDPASDSWTQVADFGGGIRWDAISFTIGNYAYTGTGIGPIGSGRRDLWRYDPSLNVWQAMDSIPYSYEISDASAFAIDTCGFVVGGCVGDYLASAWQYNTVTNTWTQDSSLPSRPRCDAAGFSVCSYGYFGTGEFGGDMYGTDMWQFDPNAVTWTLVAPFPGTPRDESVSFSSGGKGYIGLGGQDGFASGVYFHDFWEYTPDSTCRSCSATSPSITAKDTIFCTGDSTPICAPSGFTSYQWSSGVTGTGACIEATQAGDYYVQVSDSNGCTAFSNHLAISVYPVPSVSIIQQGDTLSSFGQQGYQWILNGNPIPGATGQVYVAKISGYYSVQVTDTNGCTTISDPVPTGIEYLTEGNISISPNPNSVGNWQLTVDNSLVGSALEVYDEQGRLVFNSELRTQNSELNLNVASGIYYLRISNGNISVVRKLVKL